ncbi:AMP-binding protein [Phenylobacterium sp.]|uniref:AMP-binding protein n=1 Tax=Phenylobacterium sp. TaxID=1871053 RepID=UPI0035B3DF32
MTTAVWASVQPEAIAVVDPDGSSHTFQAVNANANRIVRYLRGAGLSAGDAIALVCTNRHEFIEVLAAALRGGFRLTPVNWHLTADEIGYILKDCEAKAVFGDARVDSVALAARQAPALRCKVAIGGSIEGFQPYDKVLEAEDSSDITDPTPGNTMLYTSGTTGRPKGVYRASPTIIAKAALDQRLFDRTSISLCAGPAYHAAPLSFDIRYPMAAGSRIVLLEKWDTRQVLAMISERRITHTHLVPIMFQRLLALPEDVKASQDVSSLKFILHGAAPCPPDVKQAMIRWVGPILNEYYAGSEGGAGFTISSPEWLTKPGSVGKRPTALGSKILDEAGAECPIGVAGTIYHQLPADGGFTYFKDEAKTQSNRVGDYFTMGDVGYFDEDGYLFLTGRNAETIISGGVNIYPQEVDNELIKHDAVADSATVGVPHDEWGEQVKAVILLKPGFEPSDKLAQEILDFGRNALPAFKVPRSLDFVSDLPRSAAGKIQRNKVRAPYWEGRARQI